MTSQRDVGSMGEGIVKVWCDQVGITANKVQQDERAWDYILEFSSETSVTSQNNVPLDLFQSSLRCMIQVKSTDEQKNGWSVKLDNWERFVKNPFPCFFLILEYDHKNEVQRAFLVHVWQEEIRKILKKLRELSVKQRVKLHKTTMSVKYRRQTQLSSLDGKGLAEAIRATVGITPEEYAQQKNEFVKSVGYEEGNAFFEMTVLPPDTENFDVCEYLIDFAIGLVPHIEFKQATMTDVRFGIRAPQALHIFEGGKVEVRRQSLGPAQIVVRSQDGYQEVEIAAETYAPQGMDLGENNELLKYRLAAPHLDFIISTRSTIKCDINWELPDANDTVRLSDLEAVSGFLKLIAETPQDGELVINLFFQEKPLGSGSIKIKTPASNDLREGATAAFYANRILAALGKSTDVNVQFAELLRQTGRLQLLGGVLLAEGRQLAIEFTVKPIDENESGNFSIDGEKYCIPLVLAVYIGEHRVICSMVAIGKLTTVLVEEGEPLRVRLATSDVRLRHKYISKRREEFRFTHEELLEEAARPFKEEMNIITIQD